MFGKPSKPSSSNISSSKRIRVHINPNDKPQDDIFVNDPEVINSSDELSQICIRRIAFQEVCEFFFQTHEISWQIFQETSRFVEEKSEFFNEFSQKFVRKFAFCPDLKFLEICCLIFRRF